MRQKHTHGSDARQVSRRKKHSEAAIVISETIPAARLAYSSHCQGEVRHLHWKDQVHYNRPRWRKDERHRHPGQSWA